MQRILLALIDIYSKCISPLKPSCCRFLPSCSEYARQAISRHGCLKGPRLTLRRFLRCQPFYHGPVYDPVPGTEADKNKNEHQQV